jgi:hypothetical protein
MNHLWVTRCKKCGVIALVSANVVCAACMAVSVHGPVPGHGPQAAAVVVEHGELPHLPELKLGTVRHAPEQSAYPPPPNRTAAPPVRPQIARTRTPMPGKGRVQGQYVARDPGSAPRLVSRRG